MKNGRSIQYTMKNNNIVIILVIIIIITMNNAYHSGDFYIYV